MAEPSEREQGRLSIVVHSGAFDRVHYALMMAAAAAAVDRPVTLFFTMGATQALRRPDGWVNLSGAEWDDHSEGTQHRRFRDAAAVLCGHGCRLHGLRGRPEG